MEKVFVKYRIGNQVETRKYIENIRYSLRGNIVPYWTNDYTRANPIFEEQAKQLVKQVDEKERRFYKILRKKKLV